MQMNKKKYVKITARNSEDNSDMIIKWNGELNGVDINFLIITLIYNCIIDLLDRCFS